MSFSPEELRKRSDAFDSMWQAFLASPNTDGLLEFAVSISSFTEFLHSKGLSGLHQISRNMEQQVLSLFEGGTGETIPQATLDELDIRVQKLVTWVSDFIDRSSQQIVYRRSQSGSLNPIDTSPSNRVWLVGTDDDQWQE